MGFKTNNKFTVLVNYGRFQEGYARWVARKLYKLREEVMYFNTGSNVFLIKRKIYWVLTL